MYALIKQLSDCSKSARPPLLRRMPLQAPLLSSPGTYGAIFSPPFSSQGVPLAGMHCTASRDQIPVSSYHCASTRCSMRRALRREQRSQLLELRRRYLVRCSAILKDRQEIAKQLEVGRFRYTWDMAHGACTHIILLSLALCGMATMTDYWPAQAIYPHGEGNHQSAFQYLETTNATEALQRNLCAQMVSHLRLRTPAGSCACPCLICVYRLGVTAHRHLLSTQAVTLQFQVLRH